MVLTLVAAGAAGVAALATLKWLSTMVMIVPQKKEVILESFGRFSEARQKPGIQLKKIWPFQNVAQKVPTNIRQFREPLKTKSKDDVFVELPIEMQVRVTDSAKATYESNDPIGQIKTIVAAAVKEHASKMDFAELYEARETISDNVKSSVGKQVSDTYGFEIVDIIVDEPKAPDSIEASYNEVRASERRLTSQNNESEAEKIRIVKAAEARREAQALLGKGIAEQRAAIFENYSQQFNKLIKDGMNADEASKIMALAMTQDTLREIGEKGNLIVTTGSGAEQIAEFQTLGATLAQGNRQNPKTRPSPMS